MVCRLRQVRCTSASERYSVNFLHRRRQPTTLPCSLPNSYLNDQSQVGHISTQTNLKDALDKKYYSQRPVEKENTSPLRKQEVPRSASTCERNRSSTFKKVYVGRYKVPIGRQAPMGSNESLEKLFKRTFHSHSGTQAIYFDDTLLAKANAWRAIHGFSW